MTLSKSNTQNRPGKNERANKPSGSQTLFRGLDVLDMVAEGPVDLAALAAGLKLTRSTTHRLASALVARRFLNFVPREGYSLGPKLLELGHWARGQIDVARLSRPHLEALAEATEDTVHLGVLDNRQTLYLEILPGRRRISISSRIGERQPASTTGLGKSLILDESEEQWEATWRRETEHRRSKETLAAWLKRMREYAAQGYTFDLEENEDKIRCVAAPVRNAQGHIVAAISVTSAAQYMDDARMRDLTRVVCKTARAISEDLGWSNRVTPAHRAQRKQP